MKIEQLNEDNKVIATYYSIQDAAKHIQSRASEMAIQLNIAWAIMHNTRAYKYKWRQAK